MNGTRLEELEVGGDVRKATVGWTQGYAVQHDPIARAVRDATERSCKRLLATWSPVIDSIRLLNNQFGAIASYDGEVTDLAAAIVLVTELGGVVRRFSKRGENRRCVIGNKGIVDSVLEKILEIEGL